MTSKRKNTKKLPEIKAPSDAPRRSRPVDKVVSGDLSDARAELAHAWNAFVWKCGGGVPVRDLDGATMLMSLATSAVLYRFPHDTATVRRLSAELDRPSPPRSRAAKLRETVVRCHFAVQLLRAGQPAKSIAAMLKQCLTPVDGAFGKITEAMLDGRLSKMNLSAPQLETGRCAGGAGNVSSPKRLAADLAVDCEALGFGRSNDSRTRAITEFGRIVLKSRE